MAIAKKVGIINFHYSDHNYGAVLQAASVEHFLKENGIDAKHIDYVSKEREQKGVSETLKNILKKLGILDNIKKLLGKDVHLKHEVENSVVFEDFRNKWLTRTERFNSFERLKKYPLDFEAVIVGSDQVWRPTQFNQYSDYKVYFLSFVPSHIKKISYAASFGVDHWEVSNKIINDEIKSYVRDFSAVSVREDSGLKICSSVFGITAEHVLDPTLLVGRHFFEQIIESESDNENTTNEIVYYKLDVNEEFLKSAVKLGEWQSKKVKNIYYKLNRHIYEYYSVPEWLGNIKNSDFVITDSFHCVCFCILFEKEFLCCVNESRGLSRLQSLLGMFNLSDRICSSNDDFTSKVASLAPINYMQVNKLLEQKRYHSKRFLLDSLSLTGY
ncbi:polysaccharide pyruvyl transferase family protein [Enterobacter hormaechei]|uniref:polysaccharide pyruvyl transferase family protein n=1 Tax=Enterobacter hormaechei TaxID=158836 RepID=UPI0012385C9F|nr:polysaccharide pyruvyl transferase family protein [Enterobacter hormaechei]MCE1415307.1 polysaccharide pyruvyl transferase family protein [Enterobacter hormaechei]